jgi:EpsI family protein
VRETAAVDYRPVYRRPSAELQRSYADGEREVGLYVAYYRQQDKQRKLVSSDNVLVASLDPSWHVLASGRHATTLAGQPLSFRTARLRGTALPGQEAALVVWQAYWVDGRWTDSDALAKLYGIAQRLQGRGDDGASVVLYAAEQQPGQAEAALEAYVRANGPAIEAALRRSHAAR